MIVSRFKSFIYEQKAFVKNATYFFSTTLLARILALICAPILTRIFSPADFGYYQAFLSCAAILTVISCLGYDYPILREQKTQKAFNLLALSLLCTLFLALVVYVIQFCLVHVESLINYHFLFENKWILSAFVIAAGMQQSLYYFALKSDNLQKASFKNIVTSVCLSFPQIALGFLWPNFYLLIIGSFISYAATVIYLYAISKKQLSGFVGSLGFEHIKSVFVRYIDFFRKGTGIYFLNALNGNILFFTASIFYSLKDLGMLGLAYKIMFAPSQLMVASIVPVFFSSASKLVHGGVKEINTLKRQYFLFCGILGIFGMFLIIPYNYYESIFAFCFGHEWWQAGKFAKPLVVLVFFNMGFGAMHALGIYEKQDWQIIWELSRLALSLGAFAICYFLDLNILNMLWMIVLVSSFMYIVLFFLNLKAINLYLEYPNPDLEKGYSQIPI